MTFRVISSRSIEEPPTIEVSFANGVKDHLELKHFKMNEAYPIRCTYIGKLKNDPISSVAVSGCLNEPGNKMEVTLLSNNNKNSMFLVDFEGNTQIIKDEIQEKGM